MLVSLDFLNIGQQWPPACEEERLEMYECNRALFEGKHAKVYAEDLKRIERVIGNFNEVVSYPVVLNFQRLMSLKVADLLIGEPPQINAGDADSKEQIAVDTIAETNDLHNTLYEAVIDVSRYGDGLLCVRSGEDGNGLIETIQPRLWFPVVSPDNVKEIIAHVLAWTYETEEYDKKHRYLKARIHDKGKYAERIYELSGCTIIRMVAEKEFSTGLSDFAIVQIPNVMTSDRATGLDDYTDIDSIISELIVRVGQVSRILDKHASPSMSGPASALERDPVTGEWRLKCGNYFPRESAEDSPVEYITWDGQLSANFEQIEKLVNFLYTISEMGSAVFGDTTQTTGQAASGTALKRLMISPLAKVNRIRMRMDRAVKKALYLCSELGGEDVVNLKDVDISITWQDGLPSDPTEEANVINMRTAGAQTMSTMRVLTRYDGLSDDDAEAEIKRINEEQSASAPMSLPSFAQTDNTGTQPQVDQLE